MWTTLPWEHPNIYLKRIFDFTFKDLFNLFASSSRKLSIELLQNFEMQRESFTSRSGQLCSLDFNWIIFQQRNEILETFPSHTTLFRHVQSGFMLHLLNFDSWFQLLLNRRWNESFSSSLSTCSVFSVWVNVVILLNSTMWSLQLFFEENQEDFEPLQSLWILWSFWGKPLKVKVWKSFYLHSFSVPVEFCILASTRKFEENGADINDMKQGIDCFFGSLWT